MIWLIGGSARCGKSTLMHQAQAALACPAVPLDLLLKALVPVATPTNQAKLQARPKVEQLSVTQWLQALRERDQVLWQAVRGLVEAASHSQSDLVIEGGLWPDYVAEIADDADDMRAVFLVDTSSDHASRLVQLARSSATQNNWMREWSDDKLKKWAGYNVARSRLIVELAEQHNQPVFDIAGDGLGEMQRQALALLARR
jgi:hypothetical protein